MRIFRIGQARIPRSFFSQPTLSAARRLLGARLVKIERGRRLSGIIVETEAYIGREDLGCHASRGGLTPRNAVMFGPPGHAYVYFTYGMHWMLNLVTEAEDFPAAVLVRAMIPSEGREVMRRRRKGREPIALGPATLCQALHLDGRWNGSDLCEKNAQLFLERAFRVPDQGVTIVPRVGLYTVPEPWKSMPWRFRAAPEAVRALERLLKENGRAARAGRPAEEGMTEPKTIRSVVLIKQVPDTHNITGEVMTKDGTMNRGALPAIFNPEDLHALEMALQVRERFGGTVTVITMGPPMAADILRDSLYRGADRAILLTDRKFAGADTLATSYTLRCAVEKSGPFDLVFCGRQAIDGDTAQVGPQVAEKLGVPQITYAESILELKDGSITAQRALEGGTEIVRCPLPCLITVVASANTPRPASARRRIECKLAATPLEIPALLQSWPEFHGEAELQSYLRDRGLIIPVWTAEDIGVEEGMIGLAGSPTQVHKVNFVVLESTASKSIAPTKEGIAAMIEELVREYIVG